MTIDEALRVLAACHHRGVGLWVFDCQTARVLPAGWNGLGEAAPPSFTQWEAVTLARRLAEIGAVAGRTGVDPVAP
jgi:hypothetical protein